jgi:hypothetical protein
MAAAICATASAQSATVIDTLKGPDGAAFEGAFVQAQNTKNCIAANVLTGIAGATVSIACLPANIICASHAVEYHRDPHTEVTLRATQKVSLIGTCRRLQCDGQTSPTTRATTSCLKEWANG